MTMPAFQPLCAYASPAAMFLLPRDTSDFDWVTPTPSGELPRITEGPLSAEDLNAWMASTERLPMRRILLRALGEAVPDGFAGSGTVEVMTVAEGPYTGLDALRGAMRWGDNDVLEALESFADGERGGWIDPLDFAAPGERKFWSAYRQGFLRWLESASGRDWQQELAERWFVQALSVRHFRGGTEDQGAFLPLKGFPMAGVMMKAVGAVEAVGLPGGAVEDLAHQLGRRITGSNAHIEKMLRGLVQAEQPEIMAASTSARISELVFVDPAGPELVITGLDTPEAMLQFVAPRDETNRTALAASVLLVAGGGSIGLRLRAAGPTTEAALEVPAERQDDEFANLLRWHAVVDSATVLKLLSDSTSNEMHVTWMA
jgi:hypothetical protein